MSEDEEDFNSIVIDNGSYKLLAGFGGDVSPKCIMKCLAGSPPGAPDNFVCGDEAYKLAHEHGQQHVDVKCPIQRGIVTDWDSMEKMWSYAFTHELQLQTVEEHAIVMTEAPLNPQSHREKIAEIMFETYKVPSLYVTSPAVLSLYASGRVEGVVLDSGESVTCAAPITGSVDNGLHCLDAIERQDVAGRDVVEYLLTKLIPRRDLQPLNYYTAREIKEKCCYIAEDYQKEIEAPKKINYSLPDGRNVELGRECFTCPEALFKPYSTPLNLTYGIHEMVNRAILRCSQQSEQLQKSLFSNIILSGAGTMLLGLSQRMQRELESLAPPGVPVKVIAPPERRSSAWIGGSIVGSLSIYQKVATTKDEYKEYGPSAIHRKNTLN